MSKKVVYIDGSALTRNSSGGIAQYTSALIEQLMREFEVRILLFKGESVESPAAIETLPYPRKVYMGLWRLFPRLNVARHLSMHPDAVIYPNFAMAPYVRSQGTITITTIHDLTYLYYPKTVEWKNRLFLRLAVRRSCKLSSVIVAPSKYTLNDIKKHFPVCGEASVAYPGYDPMDKRGELRDIITSAAAQPFILFIGTIEPRKNIAALCEAFLASKFANTNTRLLVCGRDGWGTVDIPKTPAIMQLGGISNNERAYLLNRATAFAFPSLFEGFGMPVLEAMRSNLPVITSNTSSLKEIATIDNSYVIESPFGVDQIVDQLNALHDDLVSQRDRVEEKVRRAKTDSDVYTWDACAAVYALYIG